MLKIKFVFIIFLLVISCSHYKSDDFSEVFDCKVSELDYETFCPNFVLSIPGHLLLVKNYNDTIFELVNAETGKVKRFGMKGRGPNEFLYIIDAYTDYANNQVVLVDGHKKMAFIFSYEDLIKYEFNNPIVKVLPEEISNYTGIRSTDFGWVFGNLNGDGVLSILKEGGQIIHTNFLPKFPNHLSDKSRSYAYYSALDYCDVNQKSVVALRYMPAFQIIDNNGSVLKSVFTESNFNYPEFREGEILPSKNAEIFYWQVIATAKKIFLLRANTKQGDYVNDILSSTSIEVYDWDGKPLVKYNADYAFANIAIDFEKRSIYGLSDKNINKCVSKVDLNSFMQ